MNTIISGGVAMWQRHWQAKQKPLRNKHLQHLKHFANRPKLGKEILEPA